MKCWKNWALCLFLGMGPWLAKGEPLILPTTKKPADVIIYGATPGGMAAAIGAARQGLDVALVEPTDRLGGLLTSGLSYTDFRTFESLGGIFLEFTHRVVRWYEQEYGPDSRQVQDSWHGIFAEPRVNLKVWEQWLSEYPNLQVYRGLSLETVKLRNLGGGRQAIGSVSLVATRQDDRQEWHAGAYIDATYEGDLLAMAGEPFHVGRESRSQYGESKAGDEKGQADGQVQGYNLRLVLTTNAANRIPVSMPENYRREDFEDVLEHFRNGRLKTVFSASRDGIYRAHLPRLPNGKADVNDTPHAPVRLSMPDINDDYPNGDAATRRAIHQRHVDYNVGLLYFLQNDAAMPEAIRKEAAEWGLCRDEFEESAHLPPKLYIREARRLVGQHVFTENDTRLAPGDYRAIHRKDAIAITDYPHNCHGTGRSGTRFQGHNTGELYQQAPPAQIPYGVLVPSKTDNLLVAVAVSSSHVGFCALRLEPTWTALGHAAGIAAALAVRKQVPVRDIPLKELQHQLIREKALLIYLADVPPRDPDFEAAQWWGLQGGWHGLLDPAKDRLPPARHLTGQYSTAHPGHAAGLDLPLEDSLRDRWQSIGASGSPHGHSSAKTRRDWIRSAYQRAFPSQP